jgi:phospholipase/carboxylesterase
MDEQHTQVAGLQTCLIRSSTPAKITVVMLHGYAMRPADLSPFAHSLAIPGALFVIPQAPISASDAGYAWWPIPEAERAARFEHGARDLAHQNPAGRETARALMVRFLDALSADGGGAPLLLAGFSQGAMLACDTVLMESVRVSGLVMMSASRIAFDEWQIQKLKLEGLRAFVSHGRADPDLAFTAGEKLERFLTSSGAAVTWVPFDGGHEIPFPVWRQFRRFVHATPSAYGTH